MATGIIWPGSGSLTEALDTPFEFYTTDATYVTHSVQTAEWSAKRLGYPIMDVELEGKQMYACFEEAVTETTVGVRLAVRAAAVSPFVCV